MAERFERVYELMCGFAEAFEDETVENEFAEGKECEKLYERIYDSRIKLSRILDENDLGENSDVMEIVNAYERIQKILCQKSYAYGIQEGRKAS